MQEQLAGGLQSGVKLHVLLSHEDNLPEWLLLSEARRSDIRPARHVPPRPGSIVVMDRGYDDDSLFGRWAAEGVFFVTRMKESTAYAVYESRPVPKNRNIVSDEIVRLVSIVADEKCRPESLIVAEHPLPSDEVLVVSVPGLGLSLGDTTIPTLLDTPVFVRREGCCSRLLLDKSLTAVGHDLKEFRKVIVHDDLRLTVRAVLDGEGVSFLSRNVIGEHLDSGRLIAHRVPGFHHSRERALVLDRPVTLDEAASHFVTALFNHFEVLIPNELFANRPWLEKQRAGAGRSKTGAFAAVCGRLSAPPRLEKRCGMDIHASRIYDSWSIEAGPARPGTDLATKGTSHGNHPRPQKDRSPRPRMRSMQGDVPRRPEPGRD